MNKLLSLLKNPILISGLLLLCLMAILWFLGPSLGLTRFDIRLFITLVLIVLWVVLVLLLAKGQTSSPPMDGSLKPGAFPVLPIQGPTLTKPAMPTAAVSLAVPNLPAANFSLQTSADTPSASAMEIPAGNQLMAFRGQLERALQWLRRSPIASKPGTGDIVYRLPWYMVLGLPGAGKSTALLQSGLNFPYTDPDRTAGRRSIEPTRQCDLWIANEALFLDTAGYFCADDRQKEGWTGLLDEIRRVRPNKPLDGLILLVDIPGLAETNAEVLRERALRLRARLDEVIQRFELVLPVYLLFHQCDRLEGFQDFFRDLNETGRAQVWGSTLRRTQYQNLQPHQEFEKEFALLYEVLQEKRRQRLTVKGGERPDRIYRFPLQWASMRRVLSDFITQLFQPNTFRDRPIFRGFYFSSASQNGQIIDPLFSHLSGFFQAAERHGAENPPADIKPYFLHHLFTQVIFPDRILSGYSGVSRRHGLWLRVALALIFGVMLPLLMWQIYSAYSESSRLLHTVQQARQTPVAGNKSGTELQILRDLRLMLERFDPHTPGTSERRFFWGMYIADQVLEPARQLYALRLKRDFIEPSVRSLQRELRNLPDMAPTMEEQRRNNRRCYLLLKSFLMMSEANRADSAYMSSNDAEILRFWQQGASGDSGEIEKQLSFYAHLLEQHSRPDLLIPLDADSQALVARKRNYLGDIDLLTNYYNLLKLEGGDQLRPMTLSQALEGKDTDLLTGMERIPGIFTRSGWENFAQKAIARFAADYQKGYWVLSKTAPNLNPSLEPLAAMTAKLSELYFTEYNRYWQGFLAGTRISPFANRREAVDKIGRLTRSQNSALHRFFKTVSSNTFQGMAAKPTGNLYWDLLIRNFRSLHQFMEGTEGGTNAGIAQYLQATAKVHQQLYAFVEAGELPEQIGTVKNSITEALSQTAGLLQNFDPEMAGLVQPLLEQPIKMALEKTPASESLSPFPAQSLAPLVPPNPRDSVASGGLVVGGMITDQQTGTPLEKVVVYLLKAGNTEVTLNNYLALASTDSSGFFRFPKAVPPGPYGLYIKAKGYRIIAQDITLTNSSSQLRIGLQPQ